MVELRWEKDTRVKTNPRRTLPGCIPINLGTYFSAELWRAARHNSAGLPEQGARSNSGRVFEIIDLSPKKG
jgi:hypothetical protein